ncbi:Dihydrolipoamide dehydrogenase of pyruvate dehydrogenase complex (EC [uncultured Gammaproteobacteria bacterium]|nr:Dihydrolipoamide dehydrogenase of pyruvate dehydrogenase complex (EC [uncultured Gammaproteobacteria bacterium]
MNVDDWGFIKVDKQMKTNVTNIYAIGDIVGQPMLAHKGVHEAKVAAEVICGHKSGLMHSPSHPLPTPTQKSLGLAKRKKTSKPKA